MRCYQHDQSEAVGVCAGCGRGLCRECAVVRESDSLACSPDCASKIAYRVATVQLLLERSAQNARASAVYCYLSACLSGGAAVAAWFWLPSPFLVGFAGTGALVLAAAGFWHDRATRKNLPPQSL
jgi:hypothetical protein